MLPAPEDNFRRMLVVLIPSPSLGELLAAQAPSTFVLYVRNDTGGDGGGESTPAGDDPARLLPPAPTSDIASTAAAEHDEADSDRSDPDERDRPRPAKAVLPVVLLVALVIDPRHHEDSDVDNALIIEL
jgi:hypothetical protein